MSKRSRLRRSSGSVMTPADVIRLWRPGAREAAAAEDGFLWQRIFVTEQVMWARVRPFASRWEAINHLGAGEYGPGGMLERAGTEVISCQTSDGMLEFCVHRTDIALVLRYLGRIAKQSPPSTPAGEA